MGRNPRKDTGRKTESMTATMNEQEAATYLGVKVNKLRRWRWIGGSPPYVKQGKQVVYQMDELKAWKAANLEQCTARGKSYSPEQKRRFLQM